MLKYVQADRPTTANKRESRDVLPFPVGLARAWGKSEKDLPIDGPSVDAAWRVEQAMHDVELNFLKLKRLLEETGDDRPRAA